MSHPPHLLVIGCGSIGERHLRTFLATQRCTVAACDNSSAIRERIAARYGVETLADWQSYLATPALTGVIIATPAPLHITMASRALAAGRHVLIEKPLAIELAGCDELLQQREATGKCVGVAYIHHFQPALAQARDFLHAGTFGALKHIAVNTGHHFPTARPAYRDIYYRDHAQGGGAIQDALTHMANAVEWVAGPATRVVCDASHQVLEGVSVEDTVNVSARHGDVLVSYSLNQFQSINETRLDFHAERGSVRVELHAQRWGSCALGAADWTWHPSPVGERDQLFISQAHAFLDGCEGRPNALCTLEAGIQTLRFNLAALKSWRTHQPVSP